MKLSVQSRLPATFSLHCAVSPDFSPFWTEYPSQRREEEEGGMAGAEPEEMEEFYVRYYVGHKGKFGHEFLEFEFRSNGMLRYANNSNYKNDTMIRKQVFVTPAVLKESRRIILESEVFLSLFFPLFRVSKPLVIFVGYFFFGVLILCVFCFCSFCWCFRV